jgi:malate permease and related proteins
MSLALQKALSLLVLIAIGYFLKSKINGKEQLQGIKTLILSLALPATIFVALLKTELSKDLIALPILALAFNLLLLGLSWLFLPILGIERNSPAFRSLLMMIPSLAPGLSCFPIISEYLGEQPVAWAALGDLGNKIFVLILLYLLAMRWYYRSNPEQNVSQKDKLKDLGKSLLSEPVNMVLIVALICLSMGWHLDRLPAFSQDVVLKVSAMMTPLVLLFIGLSVQLNWAQLRLIGNILCLRAGLTFLLSALFLALVPGLSVEMAMLVIVFPQSAASFWPFAHISSVHLLETTEGPSNPRFTFDPGLALNFVALSLPFSTILILGIFTYGNSLAHSWPLFMLGSIFCAISLVPMVFKRLFSLFVKAYPVPISAKKSRLAKFSRIFSQTADSDFSEVKKSSMLRQ